MIIKPEIETFKWVFKILGIPIFSLTRTLNGEEVLYRRLEEKLLNEIEKGMYARIKNDLSDDNEIEKGMYARIKNNLSDDNEIEKGLYDRVKEKLLKDLETHLAKLMVNAQNQRGR